MKLSQHLSILAMLLLSITEMPGCDRAQGQQQAPPAPMVTVAQSVVRQVVEWDEYTGRLEGSEMVDVRPRVGGYIQSILFQDGGLVKDGDPLFIIDPRPFQADLDKASA